MRSYLAAAALIAAALIPAAAATPWAAAATAGTVAGAQGGASPGSAGNPAKCLPFPRHLKLNPLLPLPKPPPGSNVIHSPSPGCAYIAGAVHLAKLHQAVRVGPGLTDLRLGIVAYTDFTKEYAYLQLRMAGQFEYHGLPELPPARASFLAFGFIPVSATLQISEIGPLNAALIACTPAKAQFKCPNSPPTVALVYARVSLRVYNVSVGGVPLNVGPHCQTAMPFTLGLSGRPPAYNVAAAYGALTGSVTIPQFSGCANEADNLLFDATVSGPGNFVKVSQAPICTPGEAGHPGCPPVIPEPVH